MCCRTALCLPKWRMIFFLKKKKVFLPSEDHHSHFHSEYMEHSLFPSYLLARDEFEDKCQFSLGTLWDNLSWTHLSATFFKAFSDSLSSLPTLSNCDGLWRAVSTSWDFVSDNFHRKTKLRDLHVTLSTCFFCRQITYLQCRLPAPCLPLQNFCWASVFPAGVSDYC